jgi:hypothetical protein
VTPLAGNHRPLWIALAIIGAALAIGVVAMLVADRSGAGASAEAAVKSAGPATEAGGAATDAIDAAEPAAPIPPPPVEEAATITVMIRTRPDGATVVFDGQRLGAAPQTFTVPASSREVTIKVRKRGYETRTKKVVLDRDVSWDVRLHKR